MAEESKIAKFFLGIGEFLRENKAPISLAAGLAIGVYATRKVDNKIEAARLKGREEAESEDEE